MASPDLLAYVALGVALVAFSSTIALFWLFRSAPDENSLSVLRTELLLKVDQLRADVRPPGGGVETLEKRMTTFGEDIAGLKRQHQGLSERITKLAENREATRDARGRQHSDHLAQDLADLETRFDALRHDVNVLKQGRAGSPPARTYTPAAVAASRPAGGERKTSEQRQPTVQPDAIDVVVDVSSFPGHDAAKHEAFIQDLVTRWNAIDWKSGTADAGFESVRTAIRDSGWERLDNIDGSYVLVYRGHVNGAEMLLLPHLGKSGAVYAKSLFDFAGTGPSTRLVAPAAVRWIEGAADTRMSLEKLRDKRDTAVGLLTAIRKGRME